MKNTLKNICIVGAFLLPSVSFAQSRLDVPGLALGRSTVASARGLDALMTNPASIGAESDRSFSFILPNLNLVYGNNFMTLKDMKFYFGGVGEDAQGDPIPRQLSDIERNKFAETIDGGRLVANNELMPLGLAVNIPGFGAVAFSISSYTQSNNLFPTGVSGLIKGDLGTRTVELGETSHSLLSYSAMQLNYARELFAADTNSNSRVKAFHIGLGVKYIRGFNYSHLDPGNYARIRPFVPEGWDSTYSWEVDMSYTTRSAGADYYNNFAPTGYLLGFGDAAGTGFGGDLGALLTLQQENSNETSMAFGLSLMNLGFINWTEQASEFVISVRDTINDVNQIIESNSTLIPQFRGDRTNKQFSSTLPMMMRLGGAFYLDQIFSGFTVPLVVSTEYSQGFNDIGINSTQPRFGLGLQYTSIGLIPTLRLGMQFGGLEGMLWSGGLGWNINNATQIDFSLGSLSVLTGVGSSKWMDFAFRIRADIGI